MRIVYFGNSDFSRIVLDGLIAAGRAPGMVITSPDKPAGRGLKTHSTPVKNASRQHSLTVLTPGELKVSSFLQNLRQYRGDVFIVVSYGRIIPPQVLAVPSVMTIAVHPSFLPAYRGAAPINWAIINGEKRTGITIFKVNERLDAGEIISQRGIIIDDCDDALTLANKLAPLSAGMLVDALHSIENGSYTLMPQDKTKVTFAPKLDKEIGRISWKDDAVSIRNKVRGLRGWPEAFAFYGGTMVKILETEVQES